MPTRTRSTTDPACWECWRSRCPPLAWNYPPLSRADLSPVTQAGGMGLKEGTTPTDKSIGGVRVFSFLTSQGGTTLEGHLSSRVHCLLCRHRSSLSPSAQYYCLVPPWNRSWENSLLHLPAHVSPSSSTSYIILIRNLFRYAQRGMNNIDHFNELKEFFIMVLIQQSLLNINDVLGIVLSTKDNKDQQNWIEQNWS